MTTLATYTESIEIGKLFPTRKSRQFGTCGEVFQGAGQDFLASIRREEGFDSPGQEHDGEKEWNEYRQAQADKGLTSEVNTKVDGVGIGETVERVEVLLERHPFGFKITDDDESSEKAEEALARGIELAAAERQQAATA